MKANVKNDIFSGNLNNICRNHCFRVNFYCIAILLSAKKKKSQRSVGLWTIWGIIHVYSTMVEDDLLSFNTYDQVCVQISNCNYEE